MLDFSKPIALSLIAILHFITDAEDPWSLVARYVDALPSGSYLMLSHGTLEVLTAAAIEDAIKVYRDAGIQIAVRDRSEVERFFTGLELVEPGVQPVLDWRPDGTSVAESHNQAPIYGAVGRKP